LDWVATASIFKTNTPSLADSWTIYDVSFWLFYPLHWSWNVRIWKTLAFAVTNLIVMKKDIEKGMFPNTICIFYYKKSKHHIW